MSNTANWSYVEGPCTIWPSGGTDKYGQPEHGIPYTIPRVDYEFGGKTQRDANGTEFVPRITVYFEAAFGSALVPEREWRLKLGDHTADLTPPRDAELIRVVEAWPMTKFGASELPDWQVMT